MNELLTTNSLFYNLKIPERIYVCNNLSNDFFIIIVIINNHSGSNKFAPNKMYGLE